jgi:hypothetical protein
MVQPALEAGTGNFLSTAFSPDVNGTRTRQRLPEIASAVMLEFRLGEELFPEEREEGAMLLHIRSGRAEEDGLTRVLPLGDRIVAQPLDRLLEIVSESAVLPWFQGSYARKVKETGVSATRVAYGYEGSAFSERGARPAERALVCVAADVCFNPYACGFWEATSITRTDVRIDLRSAMNLIWMWGTFDHRPLAYALSAARRDPKGGWMAFEPFTKLYRRVLELHWEDEETCRRVADFLSAFTVERLQFLRPGRSGKSRLYSPALTALREHHDPAVRVDLAADALDPLEQFVRGAWPLCRDVFLGVLSPEQALGTVHALLDGVASLGPKAADD